LLPAWATALLSGFAGGLLGKHLPKKALKYGAAFIFIASGLVALIEAWRYR
jgi:uncharacterized membrane protein YfcA